MNIRESIKPAQLCGFCAFCLLLGGGTFVQHPSQNTKSSSSFWQSLSVSGSASNNLYTFFDTLRPPDTRRPFAQLLLQIFNIQRTDGVEHGQDHDADIGKDREPHIGDAERAEHQADQFYADRKNDVFIDDAQALA